LSPKPDDVHVQNLTNMSPGQEGVVAGIQGGLGVTRRLDAMGIRPGIAVVKLAGHLFGGPVVGQVGNSRIAMGFGMAKKIVVKAEAKPGEP
jgi:ferrous iron transport protein A